MTTIFLLNVLINNFSPNEQQQSQTLVQQEWRQMLKDRFRMSTSLITPSSLNDSVARLRRKNRLQVNHQSYLQTVDKINERKHRLSFARKYHFMHIFCLI